MLLGIILFSLSKGFSLICWMRAFLIIHVINLCGEWTGLSFWAGTGDLGVLLSLPLLLGLASGPVSLIFQTLSEMFILNA